MTPKRTLQNLALVVALVSTLAGCQRPIDTYTAANESFIASLSTIDALHEAGKLSDSDLARLKPIATSINKTLDEAWVQLSKEENEERALDLLSTVRTLLTALTQELENAAD